MRDLERDSLKPERLAKTLAAQFDDRLRAHELFNAFLPCPSYCRELLRMLLEVAEGTHGDSWDIRLLAVLMIEHQVLKLPPENLEEFDFLLTQLKLKPSGGPPLKVDGSVLCEGFTTTDLRGFTVELRRRLERLDPVHRQIRGTRTTENALLDFVAVSRRECRLTLARYVFTPDEVADRILSLVTTTKGLIDLHPSQPNSIAEEDKLKVAGLPAFEARILERLREPHNIYWVSDATGSEINSLVEYPLTTVVLVVKPPGSDLEFEIKRAGRRGPCPLGVVHRRHGEMVPPSHRLDGGSTQWLLRYESKSVSRLSAIYRSIHGTEAPFPVFHSRSSIYNVPNADTEENILNYFTNPRIFGSEFPEMRTAMQEAIASFNDEHESQPLDIPGDIGLTIQFLGHASPTQAIMSGTSSFRLDRLAAYLSDDGAETYFKAVKAKHSRLDDKRLADEILDEVLCGYSPPSATYQSFGQYVDAALKVNENRERADQNFLAAMQEIGKFWGTLLALRGNTNGESFVPRNVGLRTVWANGQWQIKVIFMDHDNLNLADTTVENLQSMGALAGTALDELYIWGVYDGVRHVTGAVDCLKVIYRADKVLSDHGKDLFHRAMTKAYRKTHCELARNEKLREFFHPTFIDRIRDWDAIAKSYLQIKREKKKIEVWKRETMRAFIKRGYHKNVVLEHTVAVERYEKFLERYSFLYMDVGEGVDPEPSCGSGRVKSFVQ